jgi:hypothetical protein
MARVAIPGSTDLKFVDEVVRGKIAGGRVSSLHQRAAIS